METLNDILSDFKLSKSEVERLSDEARAIAIGYGAKEDYRVLPEDKWDLLDDMSDKVWTSEMPISQKIALSFELYETFPSYYHFLMPLYRVIRDNAINDPKEKSLMWERFMKYLVSDNCYADPVAYVLWVEFFEDSSTVEETWHGLLNNYSDNNSLLRLLEVAGPVPFELKEKVYDSLLDEKENHEFIFKSLLYSAYDVFGKIDKKKTLDILSKLTVDTNTEKYRLLMEKLK